LEDEQVAVVDADDDLAVDIIRRRPGRVLEVLLPQLLARLRVQGLEVTVPLGGVDDALMDRDRRDGPAKVVTAPRAGRFGDDEAAVMPDKAGVLVLRALGVEVVVHRREVQFLVRWLPRGVDAPQVADPAGTATAGAKAGMQAGRNVDLPLVEDG